MLDSRRVLRTFSFTRSLAPLSALSLLLMQAPAEAATLSAAAAAAFDIDNEFVEGLGDPTDVTILPDGRAVIIQKLGDIAIKAPGAGEPVEAHINVDTNHNERGLLGVVADPNFATNQYIYFYASQPGGDADNRHHVLRYKLSAEGVLSEMTTVVSMGLRGPANHNGGGIDIYEGNLYIGVGDTGANSTPPTNKFGTCLNIANGKVLRVSLAEGSLGQPPADNPLMNEAMVTGCDSTGGTLGMQAPEKRIYAWGFRNPFRLWVDRTTGKVWVGDVGEETREEVSVVEAGKHYGYPFEEGTTVYNQNFKPQNGCMGITPASECIAPVYDWERDPGGTAIGGRILDGCDWPAEWKSRYLFGDHEQGKVWMITVNATRDGAMGQAADFANTSGIAAIKMGTDNALYLVERGAGRVARVTLKNGMSTPNSCPTVDGEPGNPGGGGMGAGGSAGNPGAGNGNNPGAGNGSGGNGNGGVPSGAGNGNNPSAGTPGNPGAGTSGATGGGDAADDGGCGCRAVGGPAGSLLGFTVLAGALGLALERRRRSRRS